MGWLNIIKRIKNKLLNARYEVKNIDNPQISLSQDTINASQDHGQEDWCEGIDELVECGLKIGKRVHIGGEVIIDGAHCWLISIGDDCTIAPRVHILAHDASTQIHLWHTKIGAVSIGNKTFIGAGSIILPGVKIGENVVIGAGSVVTRDIPDNSVAAGNPAIVIGSTKEYIEKHRKRMEYMPVFKFKDWTIDGGITEENKEKQRRILEAGIGYVE